MNQALLAKLQNKPLPQQHKPQVVAFNKPEAGAEVKQDVVLNVPIVDKRPTSTIDRKGILNKIKAEINVESKIPESVERPAPERPERPDLEPPAPKSPKKPKRSERPDKPDKPAIDLSESELNQKPKKNVKKLTLLTESAEQKAKAKESKKPVEFIADKESLINARALMPRLPPPEPQLLLRSNYYLNNRRLFINAITILFGKYKEDLEKTEETYNCDPARTKEFIALPHQKIVKDYINLVTPYRGLLLYHGLGSGKTCSSIGIAEGLKTDKPIVIMTPASLRTNYIEELKKCGDKLYKKHQFWEFIDVNAHPELLDALSYILSLPVQFIEKNGGAWFVNVKKPSNFHELSAADQKSLDNQLDKMITHKYRFLNYNGLRQANIDQITQQNTINPFSGKVVIIDEAHNFVSRIVNKLKRQSSLSLTLYRLLMSAENTKIILLTGTPIINYPNEIAIAMNILRGNIVTYNLRLDVTKKLDKKSKSKAEASGQPPESKVDQAYLIDLFRSKLESNNVFDYLEYKVTENLLIITRNPYGFISYGEPAEIYKGVTRDDLGNISNAAFITIIINILEMDNIAVINKDTIEKDSNIYHCLPDSLDDFSAYFIKTDEQKQIDEKKGIRSNVKNMNQFKRRILGLVSYFPDIDALLPKYKKSENFHVVPIKMSDYQFSIYEEARVQERRIELSNAKKRKRSANNNVFEESTSTYRIFSRAFCNFVFPRPEIRRPLPNEHNELALVVDNDEGVIDAIEGDGEIDADDAEQMKDAMDEIANQTYAQRISTAMRELKRRPEFLQPTELGLNRLSPKFAQILKKLENPAFVGLHLIYSHFRTLEGIGILSLVLEANGFTKFKMRKDGDWKINISMENMEKPKYVLYTGTESSEEKEIIRNIFNSNWDAIPANLKAQLEAMHGNNFKGEIIKVILITASGAEGISLSNVRYVHITEPYWHPVRIDQVIGRARRICSHARLPPELNTVDVFLYLMIFSDEQKSDDRSIELRLKDKSKIDPNIPLTSDEALYEISIIKENINKEIIHNIKEASIDCNIHNKMGEGEGGDRLKCFGFGNPNPTQFSYLPSYADDEPDVMAEKNIKAKILKVKKISIPTIGKCVQNLETNEVYDLTNYLNKNVIIIGKLKEMPDKQMKFVPI
jgi:hypothetical protein